MTALDVAVVGGGLGGLAAAIALQREGHRVSVYEQAERFLAVGAGISLWPNGVKVLDALGLGPALVAAGGTMETMGYAWRDGTPLTVFSLAPLYDRVGHGAVPLPRAALQDLLVGALGPQHLHLGARVVGVDSDGHHAQLVLDDASTIGADLIVGADGTHSALRTWVAGRPVERRYVGYVNYNTIAAADPGVAPLTAWITWVGDGMRASVMPVGGGRSYAFFDVPMPYAEANVEPAVPRVEQLRRAFAGWAEPVQRLIGGLDPDRVNRVLIHDLPTVTPWHRGRVVLLGDAVHGMAPDLGQGGCQALEDGLVLSRCLAAAPSAVGDALARYQAERVPRTAEIVRRAAKRAAITHGEDPAATAEWYESLRHETGESVIAGLVESVVTGPCA